MDLHPILLFLAFGLVGMTAHYVKAWLRREINGSLWQYVVIDNPRETGLAIFALCAAAITVWLNNGLHGLTIQQLISAGGMAGWIADSALNKGSK